MKKSDPQIVYLSDFLEYARSWVARSALLKHSGAMKNKRDKKKQNKNIKRLEEEREG